MFLVASFPRSGNHLVRFFIEYMTGRPTLGCYKNPKDIPIHCNGFPDEPSVLAHVGGEPIAHKAHFVKELQYLVRRYTIDGLVLVRRHPIEAIVSHHQKVGQGNIRELYRSIRRYSALDRYFRFTGMPKVKLEYEKLVSPNPEEFLSELDKLVTFMRPHTLKEPYLSTLRKDFDRLRSVNARPTNRAWGGIRSSGAADHYRKTIDPRAQTIMAALIAIHCGKQQVA